MYLYVNLILSSKDKQTPWPFSQSTSILFLVQAQGLVLEGSIDLFKLPLRAKCRWFNLKEFLGTPRIEPGAAGWEARTLPLCYTLPPQLQLQLNPPAVRGSQVLKEFLNIPHPSFLYNPFNETIYDHQHFCGGLIFCHSLSAKKAWKDKWPKLKRGLLMLLLLLLTSSKIWWWNNLDDVFSLTQT